MKVIVAPGWTSDSEVYKGFAEALSLRYLEIPSPETPLLGLIEQEAYPGCELIFGELPPSPIVADMLHLKGYELSFFLANLLHEASNLRRGFIWHISDFPYLKRVLFHDDRFKSLPMFCDDPRFVVVPLCVPLDGYEGERGEEQTKATLLSLPEADTACFAGPLSSLFDPSLSPWRRVYVIGDLQACGLHGLSRIASRSNILQAVAPMKRGRLFGFLLKEIDCVTVMTPATSIRFLIEAVEYALLRVPMKVFTPHMGMNRGLLSGLEGFMMPEWFQQDSENTFWLEPTDELVLHVERVLEDNTNLALEIING